MAKLTGFIKKQPVLWIAALAACLSMFFVPPSAAYFSYIDWRVLALLFCLMAVVAGIEQAGALERLARSLCTRAKSARTLCAILVFLCFFSSMLITNDVALLAFVPFAALTLLLCRQSELLLPVVIFQTMAANLGSMLTPVGNPQNLFLYAHYHMTAGAFFSTTFPLVFAGAVLLCLLCVLIPKRPTQVLFEAAPKKLNPKLLAVSCVLFGLCLLSVFHLLDWRLLLVVVLGTVLLTAPALFKQIDLGLLATFFFFFIFAGNLGAIPAVRDTLSQMMTHYPTETCILFSQVISNVPAAVLLSDFCQDGAAMVAGAGIGGFGTLVASLAAVISFQIYGRMPHAQKGRYLGYFTLLNFTVLFILYIIRVIILKVI